MPIGFVSKFPGRRGEQRGGFSQPLDMEETMLKKIAVGLASLGGAVAANAAVDPSVTTALTGAGTDAATVGAAVLVVIVGIFAFKMLRKAL
ncbi:MAG: major capsid protein [Ralstonia sp.]